MKKLFYGSHMALTLAVVKILKRMTFEKNEHTHEIDNSWSVEFSGPE